MRHLLTCVAATTVALATAAASPRFDISGFDVRGNTLLPAAELDATLAPYKGAKRDFTDVQGALAALQAAYARRGFNLVRVTLPEQELDRGVVRLEVLETRVGRVTVDGNNHFDAASIRRSVPGLVEGEQPNVGRISASLAQANENPAKKTTLHFQAGRPGEVDARLAVVDERPWRLTFNADNTGNVETGRTLLGVVYQNANVLGRDHVASLQYSTTAEKPERVSVYGAGYHVPFYALGSSLDLYATYSDVDSGTVLVGNFDLQLSGRGTIAGGRYNHSFGRAGALQSTLSLGLEHRAYRNGAVLLGFELGNDITVHPLSLTYWGTWTGAESATSFTLAAVRNIPGGDHGRAEDFAAARADARPGYSLARYGVSHTRSLPADWQLRVALTGQYSRDHLVPGEQFGAGGVTSVRGFHSRDVAGDSGYAGTLEMYTPNLCARFAGAHCRAVAFADGARVTRNDPFPGEPGHASIGSAGLGLRSSLGRHASLQLDYGYVLDGGFAAQRGDHKVNFRLSLTY